MKKVLIIIGCIIITAVLCLGVYMYLKNPTSVTLNIKSVTLNIKYDTTEYSKTFSKGESFEFDLLGEDYKITIVNISSNKVILKANSYGLYPNREDGSISLVDNVDTFELHKDKPLVLSLQATDVSSNIEITWKNN